MSARRIHDDQGQLRQWLEHVAQTAIDWLDDLDAVTEDLEDDEIEHILLTLPPATRP